MKKVFQYQISSESAFIGCRTVTRQQTDLAALTGAFSQFFVAKAPKIFDRYAGVLISLWLFLFSYLQHNQKNFYLDGLKKLEQRSHKCVELRGDM
jgi:hypothetical protein